MRLAPELVLRDIHRPPAPSLWPPAAGWWWLLAAVLLVSIVLGWWWHRRRAHRRAVEAMFEQALAEAGDGPAQIAALSALLRRAARRHHAAADTVDGEAWLALLDEGMPGAFGNDECGHLLLEGGWKQQVDAQALQRLRLRARERFLRWMGVAP
ncbi:DUF4381 family protein [Luteimonas sp. e5]